MASNPAIASRLQSNALAGRVAELGSLGRYTVMNILSRWTGVALVLLTLTASTVRADSFTEEPTYQRYFQTPFANFRVVGFKSSTLIYRKDRGRVEWISIPLSLRGIAWVSVASFVLLVGGALLYRRRRHAHKTAA